MRKLGYPVVFDVTHSVQLPGGEGKSSGGQPEFIEPLARAGAAAGVDGLFLEVHDNPAKALSDGTNALALEKLRPLLEKVMRLAAAYPRMGRFPMSREDRTKVTIEGAKRVLQIEADAIAGLIERIDARFEKGVELLYKCKGRVVVTGLGKSGLVGRKLAATLSSTGTPALFLHAADALHGDLGMLTAGDVLIAISSSGETEELVELIEPQSAWEFR